MVILRYRFIGILLLAFAALVAMGTAAYAEATGIAALNEAEARRLQLAEPAYSPPQKPGYHYTVKEYFPPKTYQRVERYWKSVPPPEIRGNNFYRNGKPYFFVGTESAQEIYPWYYHLLGLDYLVMEHNDEASRDIRIDDANKEVTIGAAPGNKFARTDMRRLLDIGVLPYISLNDAEAMFNPLLAYFPELGGGTTSHYYAWNTWNPDGLRLKRMFARANIEIARIFPTMGYEIYNEIYYMSYDSDSIAKFRESMKAKFFGDLARANTQWGTSFASWDAVLPPVRAAAWTSAEVMPASYSHELWAEWVKFTEARFEQVVERTVGELKQYDPSGKFFIQIPAEIWRGYAAPGTDPRRVIKHEDIYGNEHGVNFIRQYEGAENPDEIRQMMLGLMSRDVVVSACPDKPILDGECSMNNGAKDPTPSAMVADLSGEWKFAPEDIAGCEKPAFDDSKWAAISVPGMWGKQGWPDATVGWYRRSVHLGALPPKVYICGSELADYAQVWVNGEQVRSTAAYDEKFSVEIAGHLQANSDNLIAVRIENKYKAGGYIWGGIRGFLKLLKVSLQPEPITPGQMRSFLWEGAIHGYSAQTMSYYYPPEGYRAIPTPNDPTHCDPRALAEIPRTKAEINSVADLVLPRPRIKSEVALFYPYESWRASVPPTTNDLIQCWHSAPFLNFYGGAMFAGFPPLILSSDQIARGDAEKFKVLIIALAPRVPANMIPALKRFVAKGGTLVVTDDSLKIDDEWARPLPSPLTRGARGVYVSGRAMGVPVSGSVITIPSTERIVPFRDRMRSLARKIDLVPRVRVDAPFVEAHWFGTRANGLLFLLNWGKSVGPVTVETKATGKSKLTIPSQSPVVLRCIDGKLSPLARPKLSKEQEEWLPMLWTVSHTGRKKILIDAHHWCDFTRIRSLPLVRQLERSGFQVHTLLSPIADKIQVWDGTVHAADLKDYDVLMIAGFAWLADDATDAERVRIKQFVDEGGGLFLAAQHYHGLYGHQIPTRSDEIAKLFGVRVLKDAIQDPLFATCNEPRFIRYAVSGDHPVLRGVRAYQSCGSAPVDPSGAPGAVTLIKTAASAKSIFGRKGPFTVACALESGKGRVVIMGDCDWLEPYTLAKADNKTLAQNIFDWLGKMDEAEKQ